MTEAIERLIEHLVAEVEPVRRLRPPLLRALLWLLVVAAVASLCILGFSDLGEFAARADNPRMMVELAATLLTGITAVIAAFYLSLPDRSSAWALVPLPTLALWIASSGYGCYRHWITYGPDGWSLGESTNCFRFILAVGVPLTVSLLLVLRRARPMGFGGVAAMGGLGAAGIAAFLLQFFHPFDVTVMDLAVHAVAVSLVVGGATLAGRWSPSR